MTQQPTEPLDDVMLSLTVVNALEIAASHRDSRPLSTLDILLGILGVDLTWGWESVQFESSFVTEDDRDSYHDPRPEADGSWHNVPLTRSATEALTTATTIARSYQLVPMPGGALALGLLADPGSAASQALLANASSTHDEVVALIQANVLDTSLDGLDLGAGGRPEGGLAPVEETATLAPRDGVEDPFVARALRRSQEIAGPRPGSLALFAAAVELNEDPELDALLESMLLDDELLCGVCAELSAVEDVPAREVVERAHERFGGTLDPAALLVAAATAASPALIAALRLHCLTPREVAAAIAEWRLRQGGDRETPAVVAAASVLSVLGSIVTSALLLVSIFDGGDWWQLILLFGVWAGYPQEGPGLGAVVALLLLVLVGPLVAAAQAVSVLLEVWQAWVERQQLWARTGVRVSLVEQRHLVARLLTPRARRRQMLRQALWVYLRRPALG